ncbi:MAG TPA: YkgJ family cysteine cluster protein [Pyrinomonadaceae bacterium]|nr:YkgJ family cysteine cluster protein [Pyrinomonadaceae bacterium]
MKSNGKKAKRRHFDCSKCPAYCCSVYDIVNVERKDIERLAKHFGVDYETASRRFTKAEGEGRVLRRKADPMLGRACRFLDLETRRCTVYDARPKTCREFPDAARCGFYDLLRFERKHAGDETVLPLVKITYFEW